MKSQLTLLTALLVITGCSSELTDRVSGNLEEGVSSTYYIGMAHDKDLHNFNARCVDGNNLNLETVSKSLELQTSRKLKSGKSSNLGFSSSFSYQMAIVNASAKAQFAHNLQDTDLTTTYLLSAEFISETSYFEGASRGIRKRVSLQNRWVIKTFAIGVVAAS